MSKRKRDENNYTIWNKKQAGGSDLITSSGTTTTTTTRTDLVDPCLFCDNNCYEHKYYGLGFCNDCADENGTNVATILGVSSDKINIYESGMPSPVDTIDNDSDSDIIYVKLVVSTNSILDKRRKNYIPFFGKICYYHY